MAERKAVNKYYPPEWTPSKGSLNKFHKSHALRERARKLHMGILIIRFELPFNIWCDGCKNHIGMGVRYNAEKTKVGMYYTTPIYKFKMKCHLCTNHFEIQSDPQNLDYVILSGARRQEQRWDPEQNEQIVPNDKKISEKLSSDSMFHLEHEVNDKVKMKASIPSLALLEDYKSKWKDDYLINQTLRQKFREKKKEVLLKQEKDAILLKKSSLEIKLLPETDEDIKLAKLLKFNSLKSYEENALSKRKKIMSQSIFSLPDKIKSTSSLAKERNYPDLLNQKKSLKSFDKNDLIVTKNECNHNTIEFSSSKSSNSHLISLNSPKKHSLVSFDYDSSSSEND